MNNEFCKILDKVNPDILKYPNLDIVEEGIIDSLDIMNLVAELEDYFEIDFDPDDVNPETFASAKEVWSVVQKYQEEKGNGTN